MSNEIKAIRVMLDAEGYLISTSEADDESEDTMNAIAYTKAAGGITKIIPYSDYLALKWAWDKPRNEVKILKEESRPLVNLPERGNSKLIHLQQYGRANRAPNSEVKVLDLGQNTDLEALCKAFNYPNELLTTSATFTPPLLTLDPIEEDTPTERALFEELLERGEKIEALQQEKKMLAETLQAVYNFLKRHYEHFEPSDPISLEIIEALKKAAI